MSVILRHEVAAAYYTTASLFLDRETGEVFHGHGAWHEVPETPIVLIMSAEEVQRIVEHDSDYGLRDDFRNAQGIIEHAARKEWPEYFGKGN